MSRLINSLKRPPIKFVEKPWGSETWLVNDEKNNYCGKILRIKKGHRFSMHTHLVKAESFVCSSGVVKFWLIDTTDGSVHEGVLNKGDCLDIPRLVPHEVEAIEDADIIEISTFHRDEDSYRMWRRTNDYNKPSEVGVFHPRIF